MANEEKKTNQAEGGEKKKSNTCLIVALVIIAILVLLTIAGFLGAKYLWSSFSDRVDEEYIEEAIERSTGEEVDLNIGAEGEWPASLDQDLLYSGASVQSSSSYESAGEEGVTVSLTSDDELETVYDYYTGLENQNWEVSYKFKTDSSDSGETASISLAKDDWNVAVTISTQQDEGNTLINILANSKVE